MAHRAARIAAAGRAEVLPSSICVSAGATRAGASSASAAVDRARKRRGRGLAPFAPAEDVRGGIASLRGLAPRSGFRTLSRAPSRVLHDNTRPFALWPVGCRGLTLPCPLLRPQALKQPP